MVIRVLQSSEKNRLSTRLRLLNANEFSAKAQSEESKKQTKKQKNAPLGRAFASLCKGFYAFAAVTATQLLPLGMICRIFMSEKFSPAVKSPVGTMLWTMTLPLAVPAGPVTLI